MSQFAGQSSYRDNTGSGVERAVFIGENVPRMRCTIDFRLALSAIRAERQRGGEALVMAAALQINFALWGMIVCAACKIWEVGALFF